MRSLASTDPNLLPERHQSQSRFRIPQDLPASVSRHLIPVTEPGDIFADFQDRRERNYHILIRRFIYQIRYGCTNAACTTPTCLSYQKRATKIPLRKLTPLSARTLACYLASESNPQAALCPHCPQVFPEHEPLPAPTVKRRPRRKSHNVTFEWSEKGDDDAVARKVTENGHVLSPDTRRPRPGVLVKPAQHASDVTHHTNHVRTQKVDERWDGAAMTQKSIEGPARDPKSFTQSLFDTLPLRMLEWLPFQPRLDSEHDFQAEPNPQRRAQQNENPTSTSPKTLTLTQTRRLSQIKPSLAEQKPSRRVSSVSTKASGKSYQVLPNGETRHFQTDETLARPGQDNGTTNFGSGKHFLTSTGALRPPVSLPSNTRSSSPRCFSPPHSSDLDSLPSSEKISREQDGRNRDDDPYFRPSQNSEHENSPVEPPTSEDLIVPGPPCTDATYTLQQIPWQTFTDLGLIQERLEKQCLGYQLTSRRVWDDDARPHQHLALRYSDWTAFVRQCCFYLLKDSSRLAKAFEWKMELEEPETTNSTAWPRSITPSGGFEIFTVLYRLRPSEEILHFLSYSLEQVFLSTAELTRPLRSQSARHQALGRAPTSKHLMDENASGLSNRQAAFICAIVLYGLYRFAAVQHPCCWQGHADLCWRIFCRVRATGRRMPLDMIATLEAEYKSDVERKVHCHSAHLQSLTDAFESENALELVSKLAKAISNRVTFSEVSNTRTKQRSSKKLHQSVLQLLIQHLKDFDSDDLWPDKRQRPPPLSWTTLEWLRTIVLRDWDGQPIVRRAGAVGGALQMLAAMYEHRVDLRLEEDAFHTPFFAERLDSMEMPVEWLSYRPDNKTFHLLSYSFLFPPSALATYFRALNFATMSKSFETALITSRHVVQFTSSGYIQVANSAGLLSRMRLALATHLVLNVRRDNILTDAMNQLWRRQKSELMRPLKVKMGMDEGEEGIDHGGVQQEFFRCLFAEALDPKYGMFTVDERTRMTWFQPCSMEPLYKFEMLGILFSIAVFNSITLPVTFPLAFYRKLLNLPVKKLSHIQDGWPDLARGFQDLLDWSEGDVGDIFMRTYEFSFEAFGKRIDVDMQSVSRDDPWPTPSPQHSASPRNPPNEPPVDPSTEDTSIKPSSSPSSTTDAPLITNQTRHQYVKDHIFWLTSKSISPQLTAFTRGFHTCLDPTALSIFPPSTLQHLIQGSQHIDTHQLAAITKYEDGFSASHPTIVHLWDVVHAYDDDERRRLLAFVTASERVPVGGVAALVFVVQRSGFDQRRLPTSMTCFGRLLLPQYEGREVLRLMLGRAIENERGFGVA